MYHIRLCCSLSRNQANPADELLNLHVPLKTKAVLPIRIPVASYMANKSLAAWKDMPDAR